MLKKQAGALPGQDCVLCGGESRSLMCGACAGGIPRLGCCCPRCATPLAAPDICGACLRRANEFDGVEAVFEYRFPVDRLVRRFKFAGDLAIGAWLGGQLAERVGKAARPDLLVAPPLSAAALRERGFNQAVELAKVLSARLGVRLAPAAIDKVRNTGTQHSLDARARRANLREAFECRLRLDGRSVAIVDDVVTTGATADALARTLKRAGARTVVVWAVARTP